MKKILLFSLILCSFVAKAQNPLVGKPSLKLVYDVAQTKKWDFTVDTNNMLEINGTGGTPSIRFTDFAGTGNRILAVDADGDLVRTSVDPALTGLPAGSTTQVQYNNAGVFGGASTFVFDGSGNVDITGSLDVDAINFNGQTILGSSGLTLSTSSNTDIEIDANGTGDVVIANGTATSDFLFIEKDSDEYIRIGQGNDIFFFGGAYTGRINGGGGGSLGGTSYGLAISGESLASADGGVGINSNVEATFDTGTTPAMGFVSDLTANSVLSTRPTFAWSNYTTKQMQLSASGNLSLFATTNQLVLGTTNTTTINSTAPSASRVATLPDYGADANIMQATTGTFTPSITSSAGSFTTLTYSVQYGRYTRKQITSTIYETKIDISLTVSALTLGAAAGGTLSINVPYNSITETNLVQVGSINFGNIDLDAGYTNLTARIVSAGSSLQIRQVGDNIATTLTNADDLTSSTNIQISLTYLSL